MNFDAPVVLRKWPSLKNERISNAYPYLASDGTLVGAPRTNFGGGVTAAVVRAPGSSVDERAILDALSVRLAKFKQPKRIIFVVSLPRYAVGKVQKAPLRERFADLY